VTQGENYRSPIGSVFAHRAARLYTPQARLRSLVAAPALQGTAQQNGPTLRPWPVRTILALVLMTAFGIAACRPMPPSLAAQQRATAALEGSFPALAELRVTLYENTMDCRDLEYQRGVFIEDVDGNCHGPDAALPFDDIAAADFEKVRAALVTDDVAATTVAQTRYANGRLLAAWFEVDNARTYYYYEADGTPPMDWDAETSAANQVSDHWWFAISE
jgi:hypothetical protein